MLGYHIYKTKQNKNHTENKDLSGSTRSSMSNVTQTEKSNFNITRLDLSMSIEVEMSNFNDIIE